MPQEREAGARGGREAGHRRGVQSRDRAVSYRVGLTAPSPRQQPRATPTASRALLGLQRPAVQPGLLGEPHDVPASFRLGLCIWDFTSVSP